MAFVLVAVMLLLDCQASSTDTASDAQGDVLFQGDMLLTGEQARDYKLTAGGRHQRSALERSDYKWPTDKPIPYYFDSSIDAEERNLTRQALNWWNEHTCLKWIESATHTSAVKIYKGSGCVSSLGKLPGGRQKLSLGSDCFKFNHITHEAAHTMGIYHEQSRPDRDNYIELVPENLRADLLNQYDLRDTSLVYNTVYDYNSNMHYSGHDSTGSKMIIRAKEKVYQHSMGSGYGPTFQDVKLVNAHYKCFDRCAATKSNCQNGGLPNPNDCSRCICPGGFSGADCSQRAPSELLATASCGESVEASTQWQGLSGVLDVGLAQGKSAPVHFRHSCCHFHIKAPAGKKIALKVDGVWGICGPTCSYGFTEIKYEDMTRGGPRLCCAAHAPELGEVVSRTNLVVISLCSRYSKQSFALRYRIDESAGPSANQPPVPSAPAPDTCTDTHTHCAEWDRNYGLCKDESFPLETRKEYCGKTCGLC